MFWAVVQTVANFADSGGSVFGSGMYYNTVHVLQLRCACLSIAQIQHFLRKICCCEVAIFFLFFLLCPSHHKQTLKNANTDFFYTSQWQTLDYGKFQALVYCCVNAVPHGNVVIMDKKTADTYCVLQPCFNMWFITLACCEIHTQVFQLAFIPLTG